MENESNYDKFRNFLNDDENGFVIRIGMVLFGIILGILLVLVSMLFKTGSAESIIILIFACLTFLGFMVAPIVWWGRDN